MGHLCLEVGGQVDDVDGTKRAFFWTNTTSYTEAFRNESYLRFRGDFDAKLAGAYDGTGLLALLTTFLGRILALSPRGIAHNSVEDIRSAGLPWVCTAKITENSRLAMCCDICPVPFLGEKLLRGVVGYICTPCPH